MRKIETVRISLVAACFVMLSGAGGSALAQGCYKTLSANGVKYRSMGAIYQGACGTSNALKVSGFRASRSVSISPAATTNCSVSSALVRWFKRSVQPAAKKYLGSPVAKIHNISSYACRSRPSGKLSEHGKANAIDIKGFTLANGQFVSVLSHWYGDGSKSAFLQTVHRKACGTFKTVLGPRANAAHRDHFHLDMAHYRSGSYCR